MQVVESANCNGSLSGRYLPMRIIQKCNLSLKSFAFSRRFGAEFRRQTSETRFQNIGAFVSVSWRTRVLTDVHSFKISSQRFIITYLCSWLIHGYNFSLNSQSIKDRLMILILFSHGKACFYDFCTSIIYCTLFVPSDLNPLSVSCLLFYTRMSNSNFSFIIKALSKCSWIISRVSFVPSRHAVTINFI